MSILHQSKVGWWTKPGSFSFFFTIQLPLIIVVVIVVVLAHYPLRNWVEKMKKVNSEHVHLLIPSSSDKRPKGRKILWAVINLFLSIPFRVKLDLLFMEKECSVNFFNYHFTIWGPHVTLPKKKKINYLLSARQNSWRCSRKCSRVPDPKKFLFQRR